MNTEKVTEFIISVHEDFIFEDELVEPEQYLDRETMRKEYELELEFRDYESTIKET